MKPSLPTPKNQVLLPDPLQLTTIECLGNPVHLARPHTQVSIQSLNQGMIKKRQFYRRRILQTVKDISKDPNKHPSLLDAYNKFADQVIEHLQSVDRADELQSEFKGLGLHEHISLSTDDKAYLPGDDIKMLGVKQTKQPSLKGFLAKPPKKKQVFPLEKEIDLLDGKFRNKGVRVKEKRVSFADQGGS